MVKASYDQVGSIFDIIWAPLWASKENLNNEELRQSCREQWLEYLAAVGWTKDEWMETLEKLVQERRQANG